MVKFGVSLSNRAVALGWATGRDLVKVASLAEDSGVIESVWVGDSIITKPRLEAVVSLAAIAGATERVRLGTACMATFPLRNPILFAHQWASLDAISNGRTLLAVCLGGHGPQEMVHREFDAFGVTLKERVPRMLEGMEILRRLWTEDEVSHAGKYYQFEKVTIGPRPTQRPCPIWIANNPSDPAVMEKAYRRVAKHADGWMTGSLSPEVFAERWAWLRQLRVEERGDAAGFESSLHVRSHVADDAGIAYTRAKEFLDTYYSVDHKREHLETECAIGTPEECIEKFVAYAKGGCDTIIIRLISRDLIEQLNRWTNEIIPQVVERLK